MLGVSSTGHPSSAVASAESRCAWSIPIAMKAPQDLLSPVAAGALLVGVTSVLPKIPACQPPQNVLQCRPPGLGRVAGLAGPHAGREPARAADAAAVQTQLRQAPDAGALGGAQAAAGSSWRCAPAFSLYPRQARTARSVRLAGRAELVLRGGTLRASPPRRRGSRSMADESQTRFSLGAASSARSPSGERGAGAGHSGTVRGRATELARDLVLPAFTLRVGGGQQPTTRPSGRSSAHDGHGGRGGTVQCAHRVPVKAGRTVHGHGVGFAVQAQRTPGLLACRRRMR